jgi:hypothetical protein
VPAQDRVGAYQQSQAVQARFQELVEQNGQPDLIDRAKPDPLAVELTLQHRKLML